MINSIEYIAVHCSATKPNMDIGRETIKQWHVDGRGWRDIGYNFIIRRNGQIEGGRDLDNDGDHFEEIGAHISGYNSRAVGVCLVGGIDYRGNPDSNFTRAQYTSLEKVIKDILRRNPKAKIQGHRDFPNVAKACPSFDVKSWWYG